MEDRLDECDVENEGFRTDISNLEQDNAELRFELATLQ
jgi:hypothetical protein